MWGQSDLAGNVWEWVLDAQELSMLTPCLDCASLNRGGYQVYRGGGYENGALEQRAAWRTGW